ncbi:DNA internalization-related competence protein ComEC/Rec2 [Facilibium subflavum]|uniref:DNA internalization-related competence protein ComEC/Rec2 n=1 Tax=Facilibium subflavum TaxID=2219058 RepID=UPI000E65D108|nr:DNA internalization-related competence protein ComEC/Rec2 [Facilibium subflavum]
MLKNCYALLISILIVIGLFVMEMKNSTSKRSTFIFLIVIILLLVALHGLFVIKSHTKSFPQDKLYQHVEITGVVASLIDKDKSMASFLFKTEEGLIKLNIYPNKYLGFWKLTPGTKWQLWVKLKPPQGFKNPYVFDYAYWISLQGVKATGYVITNKPYVFKGVDSSYFVDRMRYAIQKMLDKHIENQQVRALASALLIGNKNEMTTTDKKIFQQTGTSHLIAISGLHIGLIALFAFFIGRLCWSFSISACQKIPAQSVGLISAVIAAFIYSMLAGFSIPTQRAFIMVFVFSVALLSYRKINSVNVLIIAGIIVVLWYPFSVFEAGFWLSFSAVLFLIFISRLVAEIKGVKKYIMIQCLLMILLIPLTIYWFDAFSVIGVIANLLAIPWVSFIVVPGLFINFMLTAIGLSQWWLSILSLTYLIKWLTWLADHGLYFSWHHLSLLATVSAILGVIGFLLPLKWHARLLSCCLILPIFQKPMWPVDIIAKATVLDVDHGLAVVVQMKDYTVVYDTAGARGQKFVLAYLTLIPFLKAQGVQKIDKLIISHMDQDHSGGLDALLNNFDVKEVIANQKIQGLENKKCNDKTSWQHQGVDFTFLNDNHFTGNNGSCVLKVGQGRRSLLLTGDIYKKAERRLLTLNKDALNSEAMVAPHHGSKRASSRQFVDAVNPRYVIFSNGDHQGFSLPDQKTKQSYLDIGSQIYSTAVDGAIMVYFYKDKPSKVVSYTKR